MSFMGTRPRQVTEIFAAWLAWKRRSRANKTLFVASVSLALFVSVTFLWATLDPAPGDAAWYFGLYWVWGLCAIGVLL